MDNNNIITQLKLKGLSKWRIAKLIGVTWPTVNLWEKEVWIPKEENLKKLRKLLNDKV